MSGVSPHRSPCRDSRPRLSSGAEVSRRSPSSAARATVEERPFGGWVPHPNGAIFAALGWDSANASGKPVRGFSDLSARSEKNASGHRSRDDANHSNSLRDLMRRAPGNQRASQKPSQTGRWNPTLAQTARKDGAPGTPFHGERHPAAKAADVRSASDAALKRRSSTVAPWARRTSAAGPIRLPRSSGRSGQAQEGGCPCNVRARRRSRWRTHASAPSRARVKIPALSQTARQERGNLALRPQLALRTPISACEFSRVMASSDIFITKGRPIWRTTTTNR